LTAADDIKALAEILRFVWVRDEKYFRHQLNRAYLMRVHEARLWYKEISREIRMLKYFER
jgi:hypothetical protein